MPRLSFDIGKDRIAKISDVKEYIGTMGRDLKIAAQEIVEKLSVEGGYKAVELNAVAPQSNAQKSSVKFGSKGYRGYITLEGPGAVYDEFGTGENGADDGHPMKGFYGLNPYNSGPFVSTHINRQGRHYWFTPSNSPQKMYPNNYTEGIPSGKQMYNTLQYVRRIKGKVIKEKISDALDEYR